MAKVKRKRKYTPVKSVAPRVNRAVQTARRRRPKKHGLADAFTPSSAKAAAMDMVKGSLGGLATAVIEKGATALTGGSANAKLITTVAVVASSFVAHAVMKQPSVAAGMIGAQAYQWAKEIPGLNDDAEFADEDALADEPDAFAEDGTPLYLNDGGELVSMEEMEFAEEFEY